MDNLKTVLMERDGLSADEADKQLQNARNELLDRLANNEMPFDLCEELFGLEPDYLEELL